MQKEDLCSLDSLFFSSWGLSTVQSLEMLLTFSLEGPTGLTCWWSKSSRIPGEKKKWLDQSWERLGLLGVLCVAFLEVTQVHWYKSCENRNNPWTWLCLLNLICKIHNNLQCRLGLGFFSTYSCGPRSFRSLFCVDRMSLSTHCQATVGVERTNWQICLTYRMCKKVSVQK